MIFIAISSCDKKSKSSSSTEPEGKVYSSIETFDRNFCNPDSIAASDCKRGYFYFTNKGHVFYTSFCDSTNYLLGTYSISGNVIKCSFTKEYYYFSETSLDPNNGDMKSTQQPIRLELNKLQCEKFEYSLISDVGRKKYVLSFADNEELKHYLERFKRIKAFEDM
jgi:hypothetical protein